MHNAGAFTLKETNYEKLDIRTETHIANNCGGSRHLRYLHSGGDYVRRLRNINYRHYICIGITLGFVALSVFVFRRAFTRITESCVDFWNSCVYFFEELFAIKHSRAPTVSEQSKVPFDLPMTLPQTWEELESKFLLFWQIAISKENVLQYCLRAATILYGVFQILLIILPIVLILMLCIRLFGGKINNDYNKDTKPLKAWKRVLKCIYRPVKRWICAFIQFVKVHKAYWIVWVIIWSYNFNVITIIVELLAFYLYFTVSFDISNIFVQILKLLRDLSTIFKYVPRPAWAVLAVVVFHKIRKRIGYNTLNRLERRIRGFLNEREFITLWCGTIGKGKTTCGTSAGLSWEIMFRDKAFELLLETDLKFPYFPWINLENEIKRCMKRHSIYNLASCRRFARSKHRKFDRGPMKYRMFGYDYERYGTTFNDKLKVTDVWQAIEDYTQLYFIYIICSSLMLANYSVRSDNVKIDEGNLPLWSSELFRRDARLMQAYSRHCHILDFDSLRLGKKVLAENKYANSFEFGVVLITEIGKERGNMLENKGKKKTDEEANQLNDLFNSQLKMLRHAATVCNYCFVRLIADEQRPESWGADAKELADIIYIQNTSDVRLAMPFFWLEDAVISWIMGKFQNWYANYRFTHGNNTLFMFLCKSIATLLFRYRLGIYNTFGYKQVNVRVSSGKDERKFDKKKYYILHKKDYSLRFASDAYSDFWAAKALRSDYGLNDLPEYRDTKASVDEFSAQNSYFMADLFRGLLNNYDDDN